MAAHRGNGEGAIYQRQSDGKWCCAVTLPSGKRRVLYGKTRKEVADKLLEAQNTLKQSKPLPALRETLAAFLERWLRDVAAQRVRRTTHARYELDIRLHIKPSLGRLKLAEVTPQAVQTFIAELSAKGLGPRSVANCRAVLRVALGQAEREGLIGQNAAKLVTLPRYTGKTVQALSPEAARALLTAFAGHALENVVTLALATGMRQGELLGLSWEDVDLEAGTLRVRRQLQRIDGAYALTELKTEKSRRTLSLPAVAVQALRAERAKQAESRLFLGPAWQDIGAVFTNAAGGYLNNSSTTHRFEQGLRRAGLDVIPFHDLRHGAASLLLAEGADLRRIMEQLGHSQISLTANTYSHVIPALMRDNADLLQRALGGPGTAAM